MPRKLSQIDIRGVLLTLSFACLWSWVGILSSWVGADANSLIPIGLAGDAPTALYFSALFSALLALSFGVQAIIVPRFGKLSTRRSTIVFASVTSFVGSTLIFISHLDTTADFVLVILIIGLCVAVIGIVQLFIVCLELMCDLSEKSPLLLIAPSFIVSAFVICSTTFLAFNQRILLLPLLPLVSGVLLVIRTRATSIQNDDQTPKSIASYHGRSIILIAVGVFLYGLVTMLVWSIAIAKTDLLVRDQTIFVRSIGIGVAAIILFVIEKILVKHDRSP